MGTYGHEGYDLAGFDGPIGDVSYLPCLAEPATGQPLSVGPEHLDARALYDPTKQIRNAATYYDPNQIKLKLSFAEAYKGNLRLYAVDWDSTARREIIPVNGQSAVLGEFNKGAWVSFPIEVAAGGTVTITVDHTAGGTPCCRGSSWAKAASRPPPPWQALRRAAGSAPSGTKVMTSRPGRTQATCFHPRGVVRGLLQGSRYVWASETSDGRALQSPSGPGREAATYFDPNEIRLQLSFSEAYKGTLHLYAVDWDSTARRELITVDGQTATLGEFHEGAWVSFPISLTAGETVAITVDRTAGANAVLSGVFLGEGGSIPGPADGPQGTLIPLYDKGDAADWATACSQTNASGGGSWIIADIFEAEGKGVGSERVPSWASLLETCHSYGRASVIGYVWTDYGEGGPASIAGIESQVKAWYAYYPGDIAGIFFDGVSKMSPARPRATRASTGR